MVFRFSATSPDFVQEGDVRRGRAHERAMDAQVAAQNHTGDDDIAVRQLHQSRPTLLLHEDWYAAGAAAEFHRQTQSHRNLGQMRVSAMCFELDGEIQMSILATNTRIMNELPWQNDLMNRGAHSQDREVVSKTGPGDDEVLRQFA